MTTGRVFTCEKPSSRVEEVTALIDKTEEALDRGEVSQAVQLEKDLTEVVERLRQESGSQKRCMDCMDF